ALKQMKMSKTGHAGKVAVALAPDFDKFGLTTRRYSKSIHGDEHGAASYSRQLCGNANSVSVCRPTGASASREITSGRRKRQGMTLAAHAHRRKFIWAQPLDKQLRPPLTQCE